MANTKVILDAEDRSAAAFASFNRSLATAERSIGGAQGAIKSFVAAFGVNFLVGQINKALQFADTISELASRTSMTMKATQELQYAYIQTGSSAEAYEKVMGKFVQTIGDAANGSRTAVDALARVGITQEDLKRKSVEQLYLDTTEALSKMTSAAERASVSNDLVGKSYKDAANAMALGKEALAQLRQEANIAGAVLDAQVIKNAKKAKDEMEQWTRVISVQLTEAFVNIAPYLVETMKALAGIAKMVKEIGQQLGLIEAISFDDKYDKALKSWNALNDQIAVLEARAKQHGFVESFVARDLETLKQKRAEAQTELDRLRAIWKDRRKLEAGGKTPGEEDSAASGPAALKIIAPPKSEFDKALEDLLKAARAAENELTTNAYDKARERVAIAAEEWKQKVDFEKLTTEQKQQYMQALAEFQANAELAATLATKEKEDAEQQKLAEKFEAQRARFDEDYALQIEQRELYAQLEDYYNTLGLERDAVYWEQRKNIQRLGESNLTKQVEAANKQRRAMYRAAFAGSLADVSGVLGEMSGLMNSESRRQFEIGKKAAKAKVLVDTYMAAQSGFATTPFFPVGIAMGAFALAMGLMNYQKVSSIQFNGGASPSGALPTFDANPATGLPEQQPLATAPGENLPVAAAPIARNVTIVVESDSGMVSTSWLRDRFMPVFNEAVGDGVNVALA